MNISLLRLLQLSDPALPVGGFSHSAGLEAYVQYGIVKDKDSAEIFLVNMLSQNIQYTDAAFVSLAYDAAGRIDLSKIQQLDDECNAVKLPKEMRQASQKLGKRLLKVFSSLQENELINNYNEAINRQQLSGHYCIAFGLLAQAFAIPKQEALAGFYYNTAAGIVTNCVKLVPLSQQSGQEILFTIQSLIQELTEKSMQPDEALLGLCCTGFDIRSMQHERLYSRLYMS